MGNLRRSLLKNSEQLRLKDEINNKQKPTKKEKTNENK
jgi:hypothetical protein